MNDQKPLFGHAFCPHCCAEFNLMTAKPTFGQSHKKLIIVYLMCRNCHTLFISSDDSRKKNMANRCFQNVHTRWDTSKPVPMWAITSDLTLSINNNDLVAAIENGHGLPRDIHDGVAAGQ